MSVRKLSLKKSAAWLRRAEKVIPGASQTFSKAPTQYVRGACPVFLARGKGSHVWDVDGNEYIDYPTSLGPIILGYGDADVAKAVLRQVKEGPLFSLPHPLEVETAELLTELIPCAEMVRFGKNGSDATSGAVRAARAYTGRELVACCGYHGWQDWFIGTTTRSQGVPEAVKKLTLTFAYNDLSSLERIFARHPGKVAAVILEPIGVVEPKEGFLEGVAALARKNGAVLIFDEIVTGFRVDLGGAQKYFGVTPDLACFGKAMANGYPIAAVAGRRELMKVFDEIFFSFTYGGETASLAAAKATMLKLRDRKVIPFLWRQGAKLRDGYNRLARSLGLAANTECLGLAPHTVITYKDDSGRDSLAVRSLLQQELARRGVLFLVGFNVGFSHSDRDVERTLAALEEALAVVAEGLKKGDVSRRLMGPPAQPVFRRA